MKLEDSIVTTSIQQDIETRVFSPTTYTYGEERPKLPGHGGGNGNGGGRTTRTQKRRQSDSAGSGPGAEGRKRQKKASENGQI